MNIISEIEAVRRMLKDTLESLTDQQILELQKIIDDMIAQNLEEDRLIGLRLMML